MHLQSSPVLNPNTNRVLINVCGRPVGLAPDAWKGVGLFIFILVVAALHFNFVLAEANAIQSSPLPTNSSCGSFTGTVVHLIITQRYFWWWHTAVLLPTSLFFLVGALIVDPGIVYGAVEAYDEDDYVKFCQYNQCNVMDFDHHCGVIGACIGKYTMPWFISFLFTSGSMLLGGFAIAAMVTVLRGCQGKLFDFEGSGLFVLLPPWIAFVEMYLGGYVFLLSLFYGVVVLTGQFSSERRKRIYMSNTYTDPKTGITKRRSRWNCEVRNVKLMIRRFMQSEIATE